MRIATLDSLRAEGFYVRADGDRLLVSPSQYLTPSIRKKIGEQKDSILEDLASEQTDMEKWMDANPPPDGQKVCWVVDNGITGPRWEVLDGV